MSARGPINFDKALYDYSLANWLRDDDIKRRLRERTAKLPNAGMQISPDQGQLMALLARSIGARRALEVGVFTGYSALCVAEALPADGKLIACDISEEYTAIGKPFWQEAGVADRIDLRIGPAIDTLHKLLGDGGNGTFDMAFIDADKSHYEEYYEACLQLVRSGGLVLIDNVLWGGSVADPKKTDSDTDAIRALNAHLHQDRRIELSLIPIGDGLTLARKR
ncbi:MAG: class I SAM-dependent methyltransferase [Rhodospirillales bacterium]